MPPAYHGGMVPTERVLVTGGAGFIGSHLVDALVERDAEVTVIDNLDPQVHPGPPAHLNPRATYVSQDVASEGSLEGALEDTDAVVHLAAAVGVGQSMYQVRHYVRVNCGGTANLLQALTGGAHAVRKLVVASSMSIYGEGKYRCPACGPVYPVPRPPAQLEAHRWETICPSCGAEAEPMATPEDKPLAPTSVYAVTKRDQEELCLGFGRAYGIPTLALRFFNVYGPRQSLSNPYTGVCAIFQSRIKAGQPPVVFEDGGQSRDFVHVGDVVQAILLTLDHHAGDYLAMNVGRGEPVRILDVAHTLRKLYGAKVDPRVENRFRVGDIRHCYADVSLIRSRLGYNPRVSFREGLASLVAWGKGQMAEDRFVEAQRELEERGLVHG